jgi:hypothetical protein
MAQLSEVGEGLGMSIKKYDLSPKMVARLVRRGHWTAVRAWKHVEQLQDPNQAIETAIALAPLLPRSLFVQIVPKIQKIPSIKRQVRLLIDLANLKNADFNILLFAALTMSDQYCAVEVLRHLSQMENANSQKVSEVLQILHNIEKIQDLDRTIEIAELATPLSRSQFLTMVRQIQAIPDPNRQSYLLGRLSRLEEADFEILLFSALAMRDQYRAAAVLCHLSQMKNANVEELLDATTTINAPDFKKAEILSHLAWAKNIEILKFWDVTLAITRERSKADILINLARSGNTSFKSLLQVAMTIEEKHIQLELLLHELIVMKDANFHELFKFVQSIENTEHHLQGLCYLTGMDTVGDADFSILVDAATRVSLAIRYHSELEYLDRFLSCIKDKFPQKILDLKQLEVLRFKAHIEVICFYNTEWQGASLSEDLEYLGNIVRADTQVIPTLLEAARLIENNRLKDDIIGICLLNLEEWKETQLKPHLRQWGLVRDGKKVPRPIEDKKLQDPDYVIEIFLQHLKKWEQSESKSRLR